MRNIILTFLIVCVTIGISDAQKYGHINFGNLLEMMPDVKTADKELADLRDSLLTVHQANVQSFQEDYAEAQRRLAEGTLSRVDAEKKSADFQQRQQELQQNEQQISARISRKRQELLKPILDRIQGEIDAYGKENGYTMIFDTSIGAMLFAQESKDLLPEMKNRLGLEE